MKRVYTLAAWLWTGLAFASDPQVRAEPCEQGYEELTWADEQTDGPFDTETTADDLRGGERTGECLEPGGCIGGGFNSGPYSNPGTTFTSVANGIVPGEFATFNVLNGTTYEWTLCSVDGASNNTYDSVLTLLRHSDQTIYCFSDDFCGDDAKIRWTASITGTVRVLITEFFDTPCDPNPFEDARLSWRRESLCPNGVCDAGETDCNCPQDCNQACGDGCCAGTENDCTCAQDCNPACGDGCCTGGESCATCPQDCATGCGDGCCTGVETDCTCPQDCPVACGDGCCTGTETDCTCAQDCPVACGDGCCTGTETDCTCPQDCPAACGDGCCTGGEGSCNCSLDCGPPASEDCNDNNTSDECDIAAGTSQDVDPANGIPDECEGGNLTGAVSRKSNPGGAGGSCDLPIDLDLTSTLITSEMRLDANDISLSRGITELVLTYGGPPSPTVVTLAEDASCPSPPSYGPYTGSSVMNCTALANSLTCTFTPGLENARTYRLTVPHGTATAYLEIRGLIGDVNADGRVNGADRSGVVGIWTTSPGFSCITDINNDGRTNAADRSLAVGAWTSPARNCAP